MRKNVNGLYVSVLMTTGTSRSFLEVSPAPPHWNCGITCAHWSSEARRTHRSKGGHSSLAEIPAEERGVSWRSPPPGNVPTGERRRHFIPAHPESAGDPSLAKSPPKCYFVPAAHERRGEAGGNQPRSGPPA
jgi:hypothetical protein